MGLASVLTSLGSDHVDGPISLGSCAYPREVGTDAGPITFGSRRWTHYMWVWMMACELGRRPNPGEHGLDSSQVQGTWQVCRPRHAVLQAARVGLHPPLGYAAPARGPAGPLSWVCSQAHGPVPSPRSLASGVCIQVLIFFNL